MGIYARDLMSAPVVSVGMDAMIEDAVRLMLDRKLSGLPVIDENRKLVGIITEGDLLRRSEFGTCRKRPRWLEFLLGSGSVAMDYVREHGRHVGDVMTERPVAIEEDATIAEIVELMEKHRIKRLPVVRGGEVVGVVSRADLIRNLAEHKGRIAPGSDMEIRDRILTDLRAQKWAPIGLIGIVVDHGEVHLNGAILDERERDAIKVLAENTPGVVKVHDHLAWVGPEGLYVEAPAETR
jgi:CBS domain-containing protein